jgi:hypothetical protein
MIVEIKLRSKQKRKLKKNKIRMMRGMRSMKTDKQSEPRSENRKRKNITKRR